MEKVVFLLNSLAGGGAERVTLSLANALAQRGYIVTLLLMSQTGEFLNKVHAAISVYDLGKQRMVFCLPRLVGYLRSQQPDVLFTALPTVNIIGITAKLLAGVGTAVIPVEHMPVGIDAKENRNLEPKIAYFLYPLFYLFAERIVTISKEAFADFVKTYPSIKQKKIRVIYNAVVSDEMLELRNDDPELACFKEGNLTVPIVIGVGRLNKTKNFKLLIEAFAIVRKEKNCRLVIMGTGEDQGKLEKAAHELGVARDVLLSGFVVNPYACMARASVFVQSSIFETLPTVVIEALACGLPIIATPCTGVGEILANGQYGLILKGYTANEMARAILFMLQQPWDRNKLVKRACEFNVERSVTAYMSLIDEVTCNKTPYSVRK